MSSFNQSQIKPDLPNLNSTFCPFVLLKSVHICVNYFGGRNTQPLPQRPWQDGRAQSQQGRAAQAQAEHQQRLQHEQEVFPEGSPDSRIALTSPDK